MKIIEALKQIKDLARKADDLKNKIQSHSADMDFETAVYADQRGQIDSWLQAHSDLVKEIEHLRFRVQKTNLNTQISIELDGKVVTKSIAQWIWRRKDLAQMQMLAWKSLSDRNLKDQRIQQTNGTLLEVKVRRYFDPRVRDSKVELYQSEPVLIAGKLEIANATTDLLPL